MVYRGVAEEVGGLGGGLWVERTRSDAAQREREREKGKRDVWKRPVEPLQGLSDQLR